MSYEQLNEDSAGSLSHAVAFISDANADPVRAGNVAQQVRSINPQTGEAHESRAIENHRYYDAALCRELEAEVFDACSGLDLRGIFQADAGRADPLALTLFPNSLPLTLALSPKGERG